MDEEELQILKDRAEYFGLDKSDSFEEFKKKYLKSAKVSIMQNHKYNSKNVDSIRKFEYNKNKLFGKNYSDPMYDAFGSAEFSNPKELRLLLNELSEMGVQININSGGALAYQSTQYGKPGIISITQKASYSAYLHEAQHAKDDKIAGWNGSRAIWDTEEHIRREKNAYAVEIKLAKKLGREDIVDELQLNLYREIADIRKRDEGYAKSFRKDKK